MTPSEISGKLTSLTNRIIFDLVEYVGEWDFWEETVEEKSGKERQNIERKQPGNYLEFLLQGTRYNFRSFHCITVFSRRFSKSFRPIYCILVWALFCHFGKCLHQEQCFVEGNQLWREVNVDRLQLEVACKSEGKLIRRILGFIMYGISTSQNLTPTAVTDMWKIWKKKKRFKVQFFVVGGIKIIIKMFKLSGTTDETL